MSTDAAVRAAERAGDKEALIRALLRAGRGREALKVRGLVVGDLVERIDFGVPEEIGKRGRIASATLPRIANGDCVYVIFYEESPRRTASDLDSVADPTAEYGYRRVAKGRFGLNGKGWPVLVETLALVELNENLPPLPLRKVCRSHWVDPAKEECPYCGRSDEAREWEVAS